MPGSRGCAHRMVLQVSGLWGIISPWIISLCRDIMAEESRRWQCQGQDRHPRVTASSGLCEHGFSCFSCIQIQQTSSKFSREPGLGCRSDSLPSWEAAQRHSWEGRDAGTGRAKTAAEDGAAQAAHRTCRNKSPLMRARDRAATKKRAGRMCPLLQVLWLVCWEFALCRKMIGLSKISTFQPRSDAVPHGWREGTEGRPQMFPEAFPGVWSPRGGGWGCSHPVSSGSRGSPGCKDAAPSPLLPCSAPCPRGSGIRH